jgi:hypothetical protein
MPSRFRPGAAVFAKDGRRYTVEEVVDGLVYCTAPNGAEAEFPESQLLNETEWAARSDNRRDTLYSRLKQARAYAPAKGLDRAGAEAALNRADQLFPGILDFVAFTVASRALTEMGDQAFVPELSIVKSRAVFDGCPPETRTSLLAAQLRTTPQTLIGAFGLGENMARAMVEKGLDHTAFEDFGFRPRR